MSQLLFIGPEGGSPVGDVVGPASSTDNAVARFNGATGKIIQNSGVIVDDSDNMTGVTSLNIDGATGNTLVVDTDTLVVDATNNRVGIGTAAPDTVLHIVGTTGQKFKGVSNYTGSEDFKLQAAVQTTNATITDLISVALAEGDMISIQARINGFQSDFTDAISGWVYAAARRGTGGNVTIVGVPVINILESDANTDITVTADTIGQNLKIQVTGVAAQNWNWVATYNYHKVLTNS